MTVEAGALTGLYQTRGLVSLAVCCQVAEVRTRSARESSREARESTESREACRENRESREVCRDRWDSREV